MRSQTPQLICVTLNTSQIALSAQTHHHLEANYLTCRQRHGNITNPHLDHHQEAVIECSPQDKISRCSNQEFIPLPLWYSSDGPILIWDLLRPTNARDFTHDTRMMSFSNQTAAVWPTSMSRSDRSSWSHRMIFLSFPPPVRTLPLLISHMQNTLPSWPLIWRMIWNAGHTSVQVNHTSTEFILYKDSITVLINCLHILRILQQAGGRFLPRGPFPVGVSAEFRVHTSRTPPESPVRMSPVLRKTRHWTNFGFSYFYNTRNRVRNLLRLMRPVTCSTEVRSVNRSNYNHLLNLNVLKRLNARIAMWPLVVVRDPAHQGALYTCREALCAKQEHGHRSPLYDYFNFQGKNKD